MKRFLFPLFALFFVALHFSASDIACPYAAAAEAAKKIRKIRIEIREIFDEQRLGLFYKTVNSVKVSTREEVVKRELLVREGDNYNEFLVQESERALRALPFLRQVSITPVEGSDYVDLIVSVQDTWTLFPFLGFTSGGGTSNKEVGITEANLLGYGKRLEVLAADDEGRQKIEGIWEDQRFLGNQEQLLLGHFQRSDGYRSFASFGRPFRSLVDPQAWSLNAESYDLIGRLFEAGEEQFIYREKHDSFASGYTRSVGEPDKLLHRYTLGYDYTRDSFSQASDKDFEDIDLDPADVSRDPELLADDRYFSGPTLSYQRLAPEFVSINFVDRFDRVEDFNLGNDLDLSVHAAPDLLGSLRDSLLFKFYDSDGWRVTPTSFVRAEMNGSGRADTEGMSNILLGLQLKYFNVLGARYLGGNYIGKHTFASSAILDYGEYLEKDFQLLLGASNGLRGYSDRAFTGSQRALVNLEDRFHLVEDVFKLVSIGGAVFADAGGVTDNSLGHLIDSEFYGDVGFGFRFGLTRSSGGSVVRVDIAFPLRDGEDGSNAFEPRILISTGQAFTARLRSESLSTQAERVSSGFMP